MENTLSDDELFEKMRSKKDKKDKKDITINSDNNNDTEIDDDTELNTIKKIGYDYYKILGISPTTDISEIKRKYRHKIAEFHPDKLRFLSDSKKKVKSEQFQLIRLAGEVLTNPTKKKLYDLQTKTLKSKDFLNQKSSFDDFLDLQKSELTEDKKKVAQLDFKKNNEKMNLVRGFNPSEINVRFDTDTSKKLFQDLQAQRDMEEFELAQNNLFEGRSFNPSEFNKMFEKNKKKEDKKIKIKQARGEMVKFDDSFTAFNDSGVGNFISVNDDYGDLFGKDDFKASTNFSKTKLENVDDDISMSSISDVDIDDIEDTYNNHKVKITNDEIDRFTRMRDMETNKYDKLNLNEFKSVMDDQFGISKDFGTIIGNDISQKPSQITSHMVDVYKKLITYSSDEDED
jgi:curved DNA-binding protein CbpA